MDLACFSSLGSSLFSWAESIKWVVIASSAKAYNFVMNFCCELEAPNSDFFDLLPSALISPDISTLYSLKNKEYYWPPPLLTQLILQVEKEELSSIPHLLELLSFFHLIGTITSCYYWVLSPPISHWEVIFRSWHLLKCLGFSSRTYFQKNFAW